MSPRPPTAPPSTDGDSPDASWLCPACLASNAPGYDSCASCRAPLVLDDRFVAHEVLAQRHSARTLGGSDRRDGTPVILKVLGVSGLAEWKELELFQRGIEVLRGLEHPGIPRHHGDGSFTRGGETYYFWAQERLPGRSLAEGLEQGQRWTEERARALTEALLEILEYLQGFSPPILHRDIKPANVFEREDGTWALIDFDLVKDTLEPEGGSTTALGTAGYAPLEQLMGRAVPASDLYGLGATLVALLSRKHPSDLVDPDEGRIEFREHVRISADFTDFIARLLEPRAGQRPADARAARALLDRPPAPADVEVEVAELLAAVSDGPAPAVAAPAPVQSLDAPAPAPSLAPSSPAPSLEIFEKTALAACAPKDPAVVDMRVGELVERHTAPLWILPARIVVLGSAIALLPASGWVLAVLALTIFIVSGYVLRYPIVLPEGRALYLGGLSNTSEPGRHWVRHRWTGHSYSISNRRMGLSWRPAPVDLGAEGRPCWLELELSVVVQPSEEDVGQFRALLNYEAWESNPQRLAMILRDKVLPPVVASSRAARRAVHDSGRPIPIERAIAPAIAEGLEAIGLVLIDTSELQASVCAYRVSSSAIDHVELGP